MNINAVEGESRALKLGPQNFHLPVTAKVHNSERKRDGT
jgi:hypothetical protein